MTVKSKEVPFERPEAQPQSGSPVFDMVPVAEQIPPAELQRMAQQMRQPAVGMYPMPQVIQHIPRIEFDEGALASLRRDNEELTDEDFFKFVRECEKRQLDPFAKQIYAILRWTQGKGKVMAIQTSIDGFRLIAERTQKYEGQEGPFFYDSKGNETPVWLSTTPPAAARVGVWKRGARTVTWGVARYEAYCQKKDGKPMGLWATMPDVMLAKCAESQALRKAFPQELSGLYTGDEMAQADNEQPDYSQWQEATKSVAKALASPDYVIENPLEQELEAQKEADAKWRQARAFIRTQLRKRLGAADTFMELALELIKKDLERANQLDDEEALRAYMQTAQSWETLADAVKYIDTLTR